MKVTHKVNYSFRVYQGDQLGQILVLNRAVIINPGQQGKYEFLSEDLNALWLIIHSWEALDAQLN